MEELRFTSRFLRRKLGFDNQPETRPENEAEIRVIAKKIVNDISSASQLSDIKASLSDLIIFSNDNIAISTPICSMPVANLVIDHCKNAINPDYSLIKTCLALEINFLEYMAKINEISPKTDTDSSDLLHLLITSSEFNEFMSNELIQKTDLACVHLILKLYSILTVFDAESIKNMIFKNEKLLALMLNIIKSDKDPISVEDCLVLISNCSKLDVNSQRLLLFNGAIEVILSGISQRLTQEAVDNSYI
ncbi:MAG: hypothetical protein MHPSP_000708 [Paramarteilia canceri]